MKNIPKICYLCWTKDSPMSLLQTMTIKSFHQHNPDWDIVVYVYTRAEDDFGVNWYVPDYTGKDYFSEVEKLPYVEIRRVKVEKFGIKKDKHGILISDILRVKLLHQTGGLYSDFDVIWLRPMSEFVNISCNGDPADFETTVCIYDKGDPDTTHHNNSNIVSEADGGYLKSIIEEQDKVLFPYGHQDFNTALLNRIYPNFHVIREKFPRTLRIDYKTFYPYGIFELNQLYLRTNLKPIEDPQVMCVHWFNGDKLSHNYAADNTFSRPCSMTTILKQQQLI